MSALGRKRTLDNYSKFLWVLPYRFNSFNCHWYIASASLTILPKISSSRSSGGMSFGLTQIHWKVFGFTSLNLKVIPLIDVAVLFSGRYSRRTFIEAWWQKSSQSAMSFKPCDTFWLGKDFYTRTLAWRETCSPFLEDGVYNLFPAVLPVNRVRDIFSARNGSRNKSTF